MDFGYDEYGNRTSHAGDQDDKDAHVESVMESDVDEQLAERSQVAHRGGHPENVSSAASSSSGSSFGDDVELVIGEEATQGIDQPLVEAEDVRPHHRHRRHGMEELNFLLENRRYGKDDASPATPALIEQGKAGGSQQPTWQKGLSSVADYMDTIAALPDRMRNVAIIGCLHHGKTSMTELLLSGVAYHKRKDEEDRQMTLKSHVLSVVSGGAALCPTSRLLTIVDTPGHPDLTAEATAGMRLADAVLMCVDAAESLSSHGERLLRHAIVQEQLPVVLVLTKVDRLILELKLPPLDAYRKLRIVVDSVNNVIASCGSYQSFLVSPERGTVCFASVKLGLFFSLETFAMKYTTVYPSISAAAFATKLWGQITYEQRQFKKITTFRQRPTFVTFILEPLYKIVAHAVTGDAASTLSSDLIALPRSPLTAMQEAMKYFCGSASGEGLDAVLSVLPSAMERSAWLASRYGLQTLWDNEEVQKDAEEGETMIAVAPLLRVFDTDDTLAAVVRVVRGTLAIPPGGRTNNKDKMRSNEEGERHGSWRLIAVDEFSSEADPFYEVQLTGMYRRTADGGLTEIKRATAGQTVYVTGLPARSGGHVVLVGGAPAAAVLAEEEGSALSPSSAGTDWIEEVRVHSLGNQKPLVHISVEVKDPAKAAQVQSGLQVLLRTSPGLDVHKEETGEYTMSGAGELQLDTVLHELRRGLCPRVPLVLSQPFVTFSETVQDTEGLLAVAGPRKNTIGCTSGVLPYSLTQAVEYEALSLFPQSGDEAGNGTVKLWTALRRDYGLDALDARNIIAAGPHKTRGPSLLFDDTLAEEMKHPLKPLHRHAITSAFRTAMAAGPLVGEVVRGVGVKLIFADLEPATRDAVALSHARTAIRQGLFGARPRLMEPILSAEILCSAECTEKLSEILQQRRGSLLASEPVAATTLFRAKALVPAMDSFGLETQIRMMTHGQAFPQFSFLQWDVVPGDPFDASITVGPLEPAKGHQLARDFVLKTRFRKGLPPSIVNEV